MGETHSLKRVSILVLLLLSVSSVAPVVNQLLLTSVEGVPGWVPQTKVQMTSIGLTEEVGFAHHSGSLSSGNWIVLSGGTTVNLPTLQLQYQGVNSVTFTKAGKNVQITSNFTSLSVTYPLTTHPVYYAGNAITVNFNGEGSLSGSAVDFRIVGGSVSDWKQAYTDLLTNADLTKLKALIQAPVVPQVSTTFDGNGDATAAFTAPAAGDYLLVAVQEVTAAGYYGLALYGATPVEVLDHAMTTTAPASVNVGDSFGVTFTMTAPVSPTSYRYGAVIISQAAYSLIVKLQTTGELAATDLFVNNVLVAEGTGTIAGSPAINLVGFTLSNIDVDLVTQKTSQIFGSSNIAIAFSNPTTAATGAVSVQTGSGMPTGAYVLLMGVWEDGGDKLVAFKQGTISLTSPPVPPTNVPPVAAISGPTASIEGDSVTFSGSGSSDVDGTVVGFFWDFGDGGSGTGASASHLSLIHI